MDRTSTPNLRVLVVAGPDARLHEVSRTVARLGHEVIARGSSLADVGGITAVERPDVAFVIVHGGDGQAVRGHPHGAEQHR